MSRIAVFHGQKAVHHKYFIGALAAGSLLWTPGGAGVWDPRLPVLALGLVALFSLVAQLSDARAGAATVLVCATAPLYWAGASSTMEHATRMASIAIATAGLGVAAFAPVSRWRRAFAVAVGIAGTGLGFWERSASFGLVLPVASVALTWAFTRQRPWRPWGVPLAAGAAALGVVVLGLCVAPPALGTAAAWAGTPHPTFDRVIAELAHAFFPYSALLPFALAALTECPPGVGAGESALRMLLLVGTFLSCGLGALSAHDLRAEPFLGTVFVAGAVGVWSWDLARGARASGPVLLSLGLVAALLALDFVRLPDKRWLPFGSLTERAKLGGPVVSDARASLLFLACAALMLAGALVGCVARRCPAAFTARWSWLGSAPFTAALLAAWLLRFAYYATPLTVR